jgi:hypothetical protein
VVLKNEIIDVNKSFSEFTGKEFKHIEGGE